MHGNNHKNDDHILFLEDINNIKIEHTLLSGQSFMWHYDQDCDGLLAGVIDGDLYIIQNMNDGSDMVVHTSRQYENMAAFRRFISHYFSLDINTGTLFPEEFKARFPEIWSMIQPYMTTKVLRQPPFEVLITFMCAQGLGMSVIRRQIKSLTRENGVLHQTNLAGRSFTYHSFPTPEALAASSPEHLKLCTNNNCVRARNIINAAQEVVSGSLDLEGLKDPDMPLVEARSRLCSLPGIGYKIADCVLLFGLNRFDAFPIDTHVRQYLAAWFSIGKNIHSLSQKNYLSLQAGAHTILSPEFAGFAGHILFHCWRKEIKKLNTF